MANTFCPSHVSMRSIVLDRHWDELLTDHCYLVIIQMSFVLRLLVWQNKLQAFVDYYSRAWGV